MACMRAHVTRSVCSLQVLCFLDRDGATNRPRAARHALVDVFTRTSNTDSNTNGLPSNFIVFSPPPKTANES
jgi:hypothetical protein